MLTNVITAVARFADRFEREEGQALAEYGLILALIAVVSIVALGLLGLAIVSQFDAIIGSLP